ncbi:unnamed protein product [Oikopleura dioica]|uniref:Cullin N-terminal domain-containing protein n=1 Tax=Oikopleura dioica TaxID=34765 RepID=E4X7G0_OIKDI|nr:unnamed protein product [Oikopleura dioica]CBY38992.1 unnamed protein product [Oikopleura dioica]
MGFNPNGLEPQVIDFEEEWNEFRKSLDKAFLQKWPKDDYTAQYSRVYKICTASPEPKSEELYANISNYFDEKSQEKAMMLNQYEAQQLLEEYTEKWTRYQKATGDINNVCRYLNKNHVNTLNLTNVEAHLIDNRGHEYALSVVNLAFEKWRLKVIDKMSDKLVDACLTLIKEMRSGELIQDVQRGQVHTVVKSFMDVCQHKQRNRMELYQNKFERRLLRATSEFYDMEGKRILQQGDVGNYIARVLDIIKTEDRRAYSLFDRSTIQKQKERLVKSLIYDALDFLLEAGETMVKKWTENADQLNQLYRLFHDMEDPLSRLVKMFKQYVEEIGIKKIKKIKNPKEFVEATCNHYDQYKKFVDRVFVSEPEMELRTPYDAIDNIDMMQPDKQFLESLKDAMRTIATGFT